jgi:transportin-1
MSCLYKLSDELTNQDETALLLSAIKVENTSDNWLNVLIPRFISLTQSPHESICKDALSTLLAYVYYMPPELVRNLTAYRDALLALANANRAPPIRELLCSSFSALVALRLDTLANPADPKIDETIAFILHCSNRDDDHDSVSQRACEFWDSMLGEAQHMSAKESMNRHNIIRRHLPAVVPVLLRATVYNDTDLVMMAGEFSDDADVDDRDQDICPRNYSAHRKGDEEEDDDDDDDEVVEWTTRKAAATALDHLARALPSEVLSVAQQPLQAMLTSEHWPDREAGVLVIGAMSFGCLEQMTPLLPALVAPLTALLQDQNPLLRSTACWTLSCYSLFLVSPAAGAAVAPFLDGIMRCVMDRTKKVQYAACSALASFASAVPEHLAPYLLPLSQGLLSALPQYKAKNTPVLLDALQTVISAAGPAITTPQLMQAAVLPLLAHFECVSDQDRSMADYLICLYHLVTGLGSQAFPPFAEQLFSRAMRIVGGCLEQIRMDMAGPDGDVDTALTNVLAAALDLTASIIEVLGASFAALLPNTPLVAILQQCFTLPRPDVQQPALAVVGDLAKACAADELQPFFIEALSAAAHGLTPDPALEDLCNNASWAIGELALRLGSAMDSHAPPLCTRLAALLAADITDVSSQLHVSVATTLGRIANVSPKIVGSGLGDVMGPWCYWLSKIKNAREKDQAYRGLAMAVRSDPACLAHAGVSPLCQAIAAWKSAPHSTLQTMGELLYWVREVAGGQWEAMWGLVPEQVRTHLAGMYGL